MNKNSLRILRPRLTPERYHVYRLKNTHHVWKNKRAHRLVAIAFLKNPQRLPSVHHIDFNPEHNNKENLMWSSWKLQIELRRPWGKVSSLPVIPIKTRTRSKSTLGRS